MNYGLIEERQLNPKDWYVGGITGADREIIREDGDYRDFLPTEELQHSVYFDSMGCVTFSALNCLEIVSNVKGWNWNRSDRFTAKQSGTTRRGNSLSNVAESIREIDGTVDEEIWPYPIGQRQPVFDWDDFYATIPSEIVMAGKNWRNKWGVQHEWIGVTQLKEFLKYGPIQVTVQAWPYANEDGLYPNKSSDKAYNHAVTLIYACDEYYEIFDHYKINGTVRKRLVPDYKFGHAKRFTVKLKETNPETMPQLELPNNSLIQQVGEGATGEFGVHLNGKIIIGPTEDIFATWTMRSSDFSNKRAITKEQWDSFPKQDTKGNPV